MPDATNSYLLLLVVYETGTKILEKVWKLKLSKRFLCAAVSAVYIVFQPEGLCLLIVGLCFCF